jgi:hypothetical protein
MAFDTNSPNRETCRVTIDQARERSAIVERIANKVAEMAECDGITVSDIQKTKPETSRRKRSKRQQATDSRGIK